MTPSMWRNCSAACFAQFATHAPLPPPGESSASSVPLPLLSPSSSSSSSSWGPRSFGLGAAAIGFCTTFRSGFVGLINIGLLIERIAGVAFNPSPRTPMSSSRRDTPRGGGLSRGGGGGAVVWASFFVRLHRASTPDSATARTRSHSAVARTGVSVHASSAGVYIITESRAVRSMPCFARWPRGPPARSSIP